MRPNSATAASTSACAPAGVYTSLPSATAVPLSGGWAGGTDLIEFELDAQPCKRYFIVAKYENPLGPSWTPFVDEIQTIVGCKLPDAVTAPAGAAAK